MSEVKANTELDKIVDLCKRRGFIFPGSEIYGGLRNSWDYGPLGVQLKNNLRDEWWRHYVEKRADIVGLDAAILMNPRVWEASGHVAGFTDPLVEDKVTHKRYRADQLVAEVTGTEVDGLSLEELAQLIKEKGIKSPDGNELSEPRKFNLLFETSLGTVEGEKSAIYLRGELAQSMFVDFKRILETTRAQVPFGIAQIGRVFRNEITPGNFTFRTLEFDLMEFEYFVREEEWEQWFNYWLEDMQAWVTKVIGITPERIRVREHSPEELSHYSKKTADLEYLTSFGWKEMFGIAYRPRDLQNHAEQSGEDLRFTNPQTGEKFFPQTIEPTFGLTRLVLFVLLDAFAEEEVRGEKRTVLRIKPSLAPYQVAVLPLSKKQELMEVAEPLAERLRENWRCDYDVTQSIGKRYRRQDEIGTPICITVDFDTLKDEAVTIRHRDSMEQERIPLDKLEERIREELTKSF